MLNVIGGLDRFQSGDLVIDGISTKNYKARDWDAYRNNRIGFVFQSFNLVPTLDARANILLPMRLAGKAPERWFDLIVTSLGIADRLSHRPSEMSGASSSASPLARAS